MKIFEHDVDRSVRYDFAKIDLAKKTEFVEKTFAVHQQFIESMDKDWIQELFLYTLQKGYRNYKEKMIASLNHQQLNYIDFKCYFASFFTYEDFKETTAPYFANSGIFCFFLDNVVNCNRF